MEIKNSIILGKSPGDEVDEDRRAGELYVTIVYIRYSKKRKTDCIKLSINLLASTKTSLITNIPNFSS